MGSVAGKPRAQTGDVPSCRSTLFWHRSRAQNHAKCTVFWLQHAVPHMWFLVCCAARLVCRLAVLCVCAHTCSLRWWALRAGCLLICTLLVTLSLAVFGTRKIAKSPPETAARVTKCGRRLAIRMSRRIASLKVDSRAKCCVSNCVGHAIWGSWSSAFARAAAATRRP